MHPTFHVSLLQPYSAGGATLGPPDPIVTAGTKDEYEVESILRHCRRGQVTEYLVHWCGSNEAEDSKISERDLIYA